MSLFDPVEAKRISDWLDEGEAVKAAEALLKSKNREHKSLRPLVVKCVRQLMEFAEKAHQRGNLEVAARHSRPASQLIPLSGVDAELEAEIEAELRAFAESRESNNQWLASAEKLHEQKRLQTAIESLSPIKHLPVAKRLIDQIEVDRKAFERYCENSEEAIAEGRVNDARDQLEKARARNASSPKVAKLDRQVRKLLNKSERQETEENLVDTNRDAGFVMDFGNPKQNLAVYFGNVLVLGSPKAVGTQADVKVSVPGFVLHQQHAILSRHKRHGSTRYFLMSHPSSDKPIKVNNEALRAGEFGASAWAETSARNQPFAHASIGCALLSDGDRISLGIDEERAIELNFHQRIMVNGTLSDTATLKSADFSELTVGAVQFLSSGVTCSTLVMMLDTLSLGSKESNDIHDFLEFDFSRTANHLAYHGRDNVVLCDGIDGEEYEDDLLRFRTSMRMRESTSLGATMDELGTEQRAPVWKIYRI